MNTTVVQGLEQQLEDTKGLIERRNLALKLASNTEFRKLILEGFCLRDCARFAQEAGDPALTEAMRVDAMNMAMAGGHLKRYLSAAFQMGASAENSIRDLEDNLADARAEEDEAAAEAAAAAREDDGTSSGDLA